MAGALVAAPGRRLLGLVAGLALAAAAWRFAEAVGFLVYTPPLAAFALMAYFFGRTLRAGSEPLINRIARREHPDLPADMARHARRLTGVSKMTRAQWPTGQALDDEVGVTPSVSPKFPNISIPYGSLLPVTLDGLLACGRHIACDPNSHGFMREIPQCWITGQAAGVGAALAANRGIEPRAVGLSELQSVLVGQGVFLRPHASRKAAMA